MTTAGATGITCTRRAVLGGACLAAAAVTAACGGGNAPRAGSGSDAPQVQGETADIPVGGGTVFADAQVVVTQPGDGVFAAFTAVCTHQGCTVGSVQDGLIVCPCHGSAYAVADGSVVRGPAERPLESREFVLQGTTFTVRG